MGRVKQDINTTMNAKIVLPFFCLLACAAAGRIFILDDGIEGRPSVITLRYKEHLLFADEPMLRVRRDTGYAPPVHAAPSYHAPKGRVGPVYTFVKTDPQANF